MILWEGLVHKGLCKATFCTEKNNAFTSTTHMQVLLDVELGGINLLQVINFNITCIQYFFTYVHHFFDSLVIDIVY